MFPDDRRTRPRAPLVDRFPRPPPRMACSRHAGVRFLAHHTDSRWPIPHPPEPPKPVLSTRNPVPPPWYHT